MKNQTNEKRPVTLAAGGHRWRRTLRGLLLFAVAFMLPLALPGQTVSFDGQSEADLDAVPVPVLNWQPCNTPSQEGFDCTTAEVPLDYSKPYGETIKLAVIRHPATDPAHRIGAIFWNPGGPGGPGYSWLPQVMSLPLKPAPWIFPAEQRARFDIISWDPRGVGASTSVQCFATPQDEKKFEDALGFGVPTTTAAGWKWIKGYAYVGKLCGERNGELLQHLSAADHAKDLDILRRAIGEPMMNYQGDSWGTYLGTTYANLFPDRVRALVLAGNINPVAWADAEHDDPRLGTFLREKSDKGSAETLSGFLESCGNASNDACAFSAGPEAGPKATRDKWEKLLQSVRAAPVNIDGTTWTYDRLVVEMATTLYKVPLWPGFADTLEKIWDASQSSQSASPSPALASPSPALASSASAAAVELSIQTSQGLALRCGDTPNPRNPSDYFKLADFATRRSGVLGPVFVWIDAQCAAWPAVAAHPYKGPWNRPTANPVLIVNTSSDPATPFTNAEFLSHTLARARLLKVNGYGHTLGSVTSSCANEYITSYFIDGKLPPEGTVCPQDRPPFPKADAK